MRRSAAILAALAAVVAFSSVASAAESKPKQPVGTPTVAEASGSQFPTKTLVLSLPARTRLNLSRIRVSENGNPVNDLQLQPPNGKGGTDFGTILMIDSSLSMIGKPIQGAMAAARAFAEHRNPGQLLALMTFNADTHILLPFTTDSVSIAQELAKIPTQVYGTHMFDALLRAKQLMADSGISVGSIVFLSDGQNVGSTVSQEKALRELKAAHIRVFAVGLNSVVYHADTLKAIASTTGGTYSQASKPSQLVPIYDALGFTLSNEYLLRYRSLAGPHKKVKVTVRVAGFRGVARSTYRTPALASASTVPYTRSWWDRFIQSTSTAALVVAAFIALIGMAVFLMLRQRDQRFTRRLGQFVSLPVDEQARQRRAQVTSALEQEKRHFSFENFAWYSKLEHDVELARIEMKPSAIVGLTIALGVVIGVVVAALTGSPIGLLAGLAAVIVPRPVVAAKLRKVRRDFAEQLPENLDVLSSALRTGHSFVGALSVAMDDAAEPSQSEFRRAIADEQLGVPIEEALRLVSIRMDNRDLIQIALVARLQRDAGTNAAEVLDQVSENVRNRMELVRLIRTLTAQGRMARWIVSLLPVFLFGAIYVLNKQYLSPLWTHGVGIAGMILAGFMIVTGSYVIKRIIAIEV